MNISKHQLIQYKEETKFDNSTDPVTKTSFVLGDNVVVCQDKNSLISLRSLEANEYQCPFCLKKLDANLNIMGVAKTAKNNDKAHSPKPLPYRDNRREGQFSRRWLALLGVLCLLFSIGGIAIVRSLQTILSPQSGQTTATLEATPTLKPTLTPTPFPTFTPTPTYLWDQLIPDNNSSEAGRPYLVQSSNGDLLLAYFLDKHDDLKIIRQTGNAWQTLSGLSQLNSSGSRVGLYFSMAVDTNGNPHLVYLTEKTSPARYAYLNNNGKWSVTTAISGNLDIYDIKIALDTNNVPHFAFLSKAGELSYRKANSSLITVETGLQPSNTSLASSKYNPIGFALSSTGTPYICYFKLQKLYCAYQTGNSWNKSFVADNGMYPSLGIDRSGGLHLAFYDSQKKSLLYAYSDDNAVNWTVFSVDSSGNVGIHPSLVIDSKNKVHISYYDADNQLLKYALGKNNRWEISIPDPGQDKVGFFSSITLDSNGNPTIAYLDSSLQRIKLAFTIDH